ncbi:MAG: DNA-binding protein, partial [Alphaproteobacteria bacterium]|nr:DNA-binding protein [Alphaproteobacteria bacterium]
GQPDDAITRNHVNILTATIVIALPGSVGTKNEVALAVQYKKPVVLFGSPNAFDDFVGAVPRLTLLKDVQDWVEGQLGAMKELHAIS